MFSSIILLKYLSFLYLNPFNKLNLNHNNPFLMRYYFKCPGLYPVCLLACLLAGWLRVFFFFFYLVCFDVPSCWLARWSPVCVRCLGRVVCPFVFPSSVAPCCFINIATWIGIGIESRAFVSLNPPRLLTYVKHDESDINFSLVVLPATSQSTKEFFHLYQSNCSAD